MIPMGNAPLPPLIALHLFYTTCAGIGAVALVVAVGLFAWRRTRPAPAPAPSPPELPAPAEWLVRGLGALWLLDGLLQAQPLMVTRFVGGFLVPLVQGQPPALVTLMRAGIALWSLNPVLANVGATWLQIGIGLALLLGGQSRWRRVGLWVSVGWSAVVWIWGEGLGGVLVGGSWLGGSPGSVLLYGLGALLALQPAVFWDNGRAVRILRGGLVAFWTLAAGMQAWPPSGFWSGSALSELPQSMAAMPQPAWLAAPLHAWAALLAAHPLGWNAALVAVFAGLAAAWLWRPADRRVWAATVLVTALTWYFGQDFGVLGGMGTDPNTGAPLLVLLATYGVAVWGWQPGRVVWTRVGWRPSRSG